MLGCKKAATQPTLLLHLKLDNMKENIIEVKKPSKCSEKELADFEGFVLAGDQVNPDTLNSLIRKAKALVFLKQGGCLKGMAIKNPNLNEELAKPIKANGISSRNGQKKKITCPV